MSLSQHERAIWRKATAAGAGGQAVQLTNGMCGYLLSLIIDDLGLRSKFTDVPTPRKSFFEARTPADAEIDVGQLGVLFARLAEVERDAVTYFACLAALQKARLKYANILTSQPFPTLDQVGPRGLLQYGDVSASALAVFLYWRKWFFDIDNRAGQETGYLFEPVIASAIGGVPFSGKKSPVKSHRDNGGRQVDCLIDKDAYELKIRVTIAASGQGRWREELDYPIDCRQSGYRPMLVVMDGTKNPKLEELVAAFEAQGGQAFVGDAAWRHLEELAGTVMAKFIDRYVKTPLADLLAYVPPKPLPELRAVDNGGEVHIHLRGEVMKIRRAEERPTADDGDELDENADTAVLPSPEQ